VGQALTGETARQIPAINLKEIHYEWRGILEGSKPFNSRVWRWVNMILWVQQFAVNIE
jgi:asparagine synthase (glutamine-hydrolysing)